VNVWSTVRVSKDTAARLRRVRFEIERSESEGVNRVCYDTAINTLIDRWQNHLPPSRL
jgi:hypothetical protein